MKLLLDTHVLLWTLLDDDKLSDKARQLILDDSNEIYISVLSFWEIEMKRLLHPDKLPFSADRIKKYCDRSAFSYLPLYDKHICFLKRLNEHEAAALHKDPFDRMLICQAASENMLFLTHDKLIAKYKLPCICIV